MKHVTESLSAYLDDELSSEERAGIEAHLRSCADCATMLDELRRVVSAASRATTYDAAPEQDLWTGIKARIDATNLVKAPSLSAIEGPALSVVEGRRRTWQVTLSVPQLAAAAVLLMAVSGGTAWLLRGASPAGTVPVGVSIGITPTIQAEVEHTPAPGTVRLVNFADPQYDAAVADLERALEERRNDLNPRTVEILERNLKLIDAAIAQARQALEEDPANSYLNQHLVDSRRRKLDLLRRATAIEGD
jgi:anti-sigma factor RsiW